MLPQIKDQQFWENFACLEMGLFDFEKTSNNVDILAFEENKYAATYLHFFADLSPLSSAIEVHFTEYDKQFCAFLNGKSSLLCEQLVY